MLLYILISKIRLLSKYFLSVEVRQWEARGTIYFHEIKTYFISWLCIWSHHEADYEGSDCDCDPLLGGALAWHRLHGGQKRGGGGCIWEEYILRRVAGNCQGSDSKHEERGSWGCHDVTTEAAEPINRALSHSLKGSHPLLPPLPPAPAIPLPSTLVPSFKPPGTKYQLFSQQSSSPSPTTSIQHWRKIIDLVPLDNSKTATFFSQLFSNSKPLQL